MNDSPVLKVSKRSSFGKGAARQARRAGRVPIVIYGHGKDPVHVSADAHEIFLIVKDNPNAVISLAGVDKGQMALVKDIQRHPVRREIIHLDLLLVKADEAVEVEVPVELIGEPAPGVNYVQELLNLLITAPAASIPERIEVSIDGLGDGVVLRVADITLPAGVSTDLDPESDIATFQTVRDAVVADEASPAASAGEETASGSQES